MSTNPNGTGTRQENTVVGSIPTVLPSEVAQSLAYHLESTYYEWTDVSFDGLNRRIDRDNLEKVIQKYWDSMV